MQTGPPASERAGIYEWHHCASAAAASGRQWAFVRLHPIFLSRADAFVRGAARARAPTHDRSLARTYARLPSTSSRFKDSKTGTI